MSNIMRVCKAVTFVFTTNLVVLTLVSCQTISNAQSRDKEDNERVLYTIVIDSSGKIKIMNDKNELINPDQYPIVIQEKKEFSIEHRITISRFRGSHYDVVDVDGVPYKIPLPH